MLGVWLIDDNPHVMKINKVDLRILVDYHLHNKIYSFFIDENNIIVWMCISFTAAWMSLKIQASQMGSKYYDINICSLFIQ